MDRDDAPFDDGAGIETPPVVLRVARVDLATQTAERLAAPVVAETPGKRRWSWRLTAPVVGMALATPLVTLALSLGWKLAEQTSAEAEAVGDSARVARSARRDEPIATLGARLAPRPAKPQATKADHDKLARDESDSVPR